MQPIPQKIKNQIDQDPFYKSCCLKGVGHCEGRIEMHHNLIYARKQQNYLFCILPLCTHHHSKEKSLDLRDRLDWIMINRTNLEFLYKNFPKSGWLQLFYYLNKKYA